VVLADVAVAQPGRGLERRVVDHDGVVLLVGAAQPVQDRHGVLDGRLLDRHRAEAAGKRGVALDLAVLGERGGADHAQLAARQERLEDVGRVHAALGVTRAEHGVQLVDEQDRVAVGRVLERLLQALLELAAELGAGDHPAQVERDQAGAVERLGDVLVVDAERQAFGDGGLADAGLADQHGVVLAPAGEDLDRLGDLIVAADDRVDPACRRVGGQVTAELAESTGVALGLSGLAVADFDRARFT
jgi:hypothetical protein